ncbi:MAG TPA: lipopolysaccharide biosynthesis protein [Rhizomicrobium sp.]|jgi:O-antigen/teichoic acid export membrane protein|nr:lipopolysaccharide biosynthesis protein [Rhizomicrobium sp.]
MPNEEKPTERSLNSHMFSGSVWMIGLRWTIRLTGVVSTIILARLLTPADFGIVAMAMLVVGMLEILNQTGQKLAIIRHASPTREHYDTAWTISVITGLVIGTTIFAIAPLTSVYFHEPRAVPVMQCLALRSVIGGFENIGTTNFRRDLKFDKFFLYNMYPKMFSFIVTVGLAILWRNYWALVAGILCSQLSMNAISYLMHSYRPRFSLAKIGELWTFSGWTLFRTIGNFLNFQIDQLVVGGMFGASAMGRYAVAEDIASSPSEEINEPMVAVLYPVMAKVLGDKERLRQLYLRVLCWSAIICTSAGVGVTLVAHDMVLLVLGSKWSNVEPLMGWLALAAALLGLSSGAYTAFDAIGKPHLGARMQWVRLSFLVASIVPVAFLVGNMEAIAITRLVVTAIFMPTLFFAVGREIDVSAADYLRVLWRPFLAAAVMAALTVTANLNMAPGNLRLLFDVLLGATSYSGTLLALWALSGSPDAPEKDVASFLKQLALSATAKLRATS